MLFFRLQAWLETALCNITQIIGRYQGAVGPGKAAKMLKLMRFPPRERSGGMLGRRSPHHARAPRASAYVCVRGRLRACAAGAHTHRDDFQGKKKPEESDWGFTPA